MPPLTGYIYSIYRIIPTVRIQIKAVYGFGIQILYRIRIEEAAGFGIVISALEEIQPGLGVINITTVAEGVAVAQRQIAVHIGESV